MFRWLSPLDQAKSTAQQLYGSSVAAARQACHYTRYRVADTLDGRFEMVVLHVFLLLERLKSEGEHGRKVGQALMEALFESMDDDMREMGIGDLTVPKKMQQAAAAFFGRAKAYDEALASAHPDALEAALVRNIPAMAGTDLDGAGLSDYMRDMTRQLEAMPAHDLFSAQFRFPGSDRPAET